MSDCVSAELVRGNDNLSTAETGIGQGENAAVVVVVYLEMNPSVPEAHDFGAVYMSSSVGKQGSINTCAVQANVFESPKAIVFGIVVEARIPPFDFRFKKKYYKCCTAQEVTVGDTYCVSVVDGARCTVIDTEDHVSYAYEATDGSDGRKNSGSAIASSLSEYAGKGNVDSVVDTLYVDPIELEWPEGCASINPEKKGSVVGCATYDPIHQVAVSYRP